MGKERKEKVTYCGGMKPRPKNIKKKRSFLIKLVKRSRRRGEVNCTITCVSEDATEGPQPTSMEPEPTEPEPTNQPPTDDCKCGLAKRSTKIVMGIETEVNEYPWQAALLLNDNFQCGGSLISDMWVLSAA